MSHPIQVKRPDVVDDVRALAALTGVSLTDAIANAVRAQLAVERVNADAARAKRRKDAETLLQELRALPVIGPRLTDDDLYDAEGLPK
jgi:hypothetical protein